MAKDYLTDNERYIRQLRSDLQQGIFNNPFTGSRYDLSGIPGGEQLGGVADYLMGGGMDIYGMGADVLTPGVERDWSSEDALSLAQTAGSVAVPRVLSGTVNAAGKGLSGLGKGIYNTATGRTAKAVSKKVPQPKVTLGKPYKAKRGEIGGQAGKTTFQNNKAKLNSGQQQQAKKQLATMGKPKGGVRPPTPPQTKRQTGRNLLKAGAGAAALGGIAALNSDGDEENLNATPVRPLTESNSQPTNKATPNNPQRDLDNPDPQNMGGGQAGAQAGAQKRGVEALTPAGLRNAAMSTQPAPNAGRDVFNAALRFGNQDKLNYANELTADAIKRDRERRRSEAQAAEAQRQENIFQDAFKNSPTGREMGAFEDLDPETQAEMRRRYRKFNSYDSTANSRAQKQRALDLEGNVEYLRPGDDIDQEIRRRKLQRLLEASGSSGIGRIGNMSSI